MPIRLRLTLVSTLTLMIMLGSSGAFVYQRHASDLDNLIRQGLDARAGELANFARGGGRLSTTRLAQPDESFSAIVGRSGRVTDATPNVATTALLSGIDIARARRGAIVRVIRLPGFDRPVRVLAGPLDSDARRVGLVGVALADRDEALVALRDELLLAALVQVVIGTVLAYALAAAALRPVEAMRARAAEISASNGERRLPISSARDELARLGETLNVMIDRLQSAVERERRFAADASHELRTPLALLRTEIDLALDGARPRDELVSALRSAGEETDRLTRLADDLLLLARADEDQLALQPGPVSADDLFAQVAGRFAAAAEAQGRSLRTSCPDGLTIVVDRVALDRGLSNLIANALQHGAGAIDVFATVEPLTLHVTDEGDPVPDPASLFERFRRGSGSADGSGLGLALTSAIAQAHGGSAGVTSTAGCFDAWIRLPEPS